MLKNILRSKMLVLIIFFSTHLSSLSYGQGNFQDVLKSVNSSPLSTSGEKTRFIDDIHYVPSFDPGEFTDLADAEEAAELAFPFINEAALTAAAYTQKDAKAGTRNAANVVYVLTRHPEEAATGYMKDYLLQHFEDAEGIAVIEEDFRKSAAQKNPCYSKVKVIDGAGIKASITFVDLTQARMEIRTCIMFGMAKAIGLLNPIHGSEIKSILSTDNRAQDFSDFDKQLLLELYSD